VTNFVVKNSRAVPVQVQMADQNEDDLNTLSRKGPPDINAAALQGANRAYFDVARPTADLVLPTLSEHVLGQLMQLLMLATVVEGRLLGINPYGQAGGEVYRRHMRELLKR
jgi:glucose-6-phosphate isomerase